MIFRIDTESSEIQAINTISTVDQQREDEATYLRYHNVLWHRHSDHEEFESDPIHFIKFYLAANRLDKNIVDMYKWITPQCRQKHSILADQVQRLEWRIERAEKFAKKWGFKLPELKNKLPKELIKMRSLNWAS